MRAVQRSLAEVSLSNIFSLPSLLFPVKGGYIHHLLQCVFQNCVNSEQNNDHYIQMVDRKIRKELIGRGHFAKNKSDDIVGDSRLISQTKQKAMRYAMSNSAVLIVGETGVGKEMFAQSIHNYSNRKYKPFVAVNCAALPQSIMESELFGYVKGAFTGARSEGKLGIFELAHTGTVFLDEISELPLDVQAKLLRVIQEKELTRVGDDKTISIDVRVIAACNTNLRECVSNKTFRQDLYYRIAVLELKIPPLRERTEDIPHLVAQIIKGKETQHIKQVTEDAMALLKQYFWPGNIRQLINTMERLDIMCDDGIIRQENVKSAMEDDQEQTDPNSLYNCQNMQCNNLLASAESELIHTVLKITGGNREKAAAMLGISPTTLWRKTKEWNLI